jgi:type II secretory pathway component PulC
VAVVDAGLGRFLQRVDVEPSFAAGQFQGFRIVALRPPAFWRSVDLRPGDIVLQVNHMPIERETQAYDAFQTLRASPELRVDYLRDGQPRVLRYAIADVQ